MTGKDRGGLKRLAMVGLIVGIMCVCLLIAFVLLGQNGKALSKDMLELRIQTSGNDSAFILGGGDIKDVGRAGDNVVLHLTDVGAQKFRKACLDNGATGDPMNHNIIVRDNGKTVFSAPLSSGLTADINNSTVDTLTYKYAAA